MVRLDALKSGGSPLELTVAGKNSITLKDVLVGEVWLCSGQSNMEFTVSKAKKKFAGTINEAEEIANGKWPQIRSFNVKLSAKETVQNAVSGQWLVCSPETVGDFSAVGYFMARKLHQDLNVPVGIINTSYGARTAGLDQQRVSPIGSETRNKHSIRTRKATDQHNPYVLYNAMLAPLIPYAIRALAWYQGESITTKGEGYYASLVRASSKIGGSVGARAISLSSSSKSPASRPKTLPTYARNNTLSSNAPNTFLTISTDIGDPKDVHPHNKQEFGRRLALVAEKGVYGQKVVSQGPIFDSMKIEGNQARIRFINQDGKLSVKGNKLVGFVIAGADGRFQPAQAKIEGNEVIVSSPNVSMPVNVRYGWEGWVIATLTNGTDLPLGPSAPMALRFRSAAKIGWQQDQKVSRPNGTDPVNSEEDAGLRRLQSVVRRG